MERVITDAGKGQEHAPAIAIEMGLDVFHTQRELQRVVHRKWKQAEHQVEAAAQADHKVEQSTQRGRDARGVAPQAWRAWRKAEWLFDEAVQAESATARIETALAVFRPEGGLNDRQWAQGQLHAAMQLLTGPEWGKVRRLLSDARALKHLDWAQEQLIQAVEDPLWREAFARLWSLRETMMHTYGEKRVRLAQLTALEQAVCQRLWPEWQSAYARVHERLRRVVRASSAVECLNSVVRMHQARHRHVSQGILDLKTTVLEWSYLSSWQAQRGLSL